MAKCIIIDMEDGTGVVVRRTLETATEDMLTDHERAINFLYDKVKKLNKPAVKMVGENAKKITITHFKFFTDSEEYFGKEIKFNNKTYKYIGIEKSTGINVFWDIENRRIMTSKQP